MMTRAKLLTAALALGSVFMGLTGVSAQSASAAPAPIKVGVICSCSGVVGSAFVDAVDGYLAWAKAANAAGGIAGHHIDVIDENDQSTPGTALSDAKQLVSDGVAAVMVGSIVQQAVIPVLASAGIPVVGEVYGISGLPQNTDVFDGGDTTAPTSVSYATDIDLAKAAHITKLAYLYETTAVTGITPPGLEAAATKAGIDIVYSVGTSLFQTNYESECIAAEQAGATGLIVGTGAPSNIEDTASSCHLEGYNPIYITSAENYAMIAPALAKNTYMSSSAEPFFYVADPAVKTWRATLNKYFPGEINSPNLDADTQLATYEGGLLLHDALIAAHLTTSEKVTSALVVKGLYLLKGDTLGGLSPPITYKRGTDHVIDCWFESRYLNDKTSIVNGGKPVCA